MMNRLTSINKLVRSWCPIFVSLAAPLPSDSCSQVRVVLLAATPLDRLFVHSGGDDERDRQLLDDLGLSGVRSHLQ